jgi:N-acetyltransferase
METEMGSINEEEFLSRRTFLYILRGKVAACVSAERLQHAFTIISNQKENEPSDIQLESAIVCSDVKQPAVLGVTYIWVNKNYRRSGLASKLVDTVRSKFEFGYRILPKQCAFCQPTRLGLHFARKYVGSNQVLVY